MKTLRNLKDIIARKTAATIIERSFFIKIIQEMGLNRLYGFKTIGLHTTGWEKNI